MSRIFQAGVLRAQCAAILEAAGSSAAEATQVADNLVLANLSGHDSHGVGMLPRYVDAVAEGGLVPGASVAVMPTAAQPRAIASAAALRATGG